jgi:tRNA G10  N-methylase Trm11
MGIMVGMAHHRSTQSARYSPSRAKSWRKSFSTNIKPIVTETPVGRSEKTAGSFSRFFSRFFKYFFQNNFSESDFVGLGLLWHFVPRA